MTLVEFFQVGSNAINTAWGAFSTPLAYLDGFSIADILASLMLMQIIGWFFARIVKGKSVKPPGSSSEESIETDQKSTSTDFDFGEEALNTMDDNYEPLPSWDDDILEV